MKLRLKEVRLPRGGVIFLAALIVSAPAVIATAGDYRTTPEGLVKHRHTDNYWTLNGIGSADPQLRDAVNAARVEWDSKLQTRDTVRIQSRLTNPVISVNRQPLGDNEAHAVWNAGFHPPEATTTLTFNSTKTNGLTSNYQQGIACKAFGGILGLEVAAPARGDCMSDSMNKSVSAKSADLIDEFYGPTVEFEGRLAHAPTNARSTGIYELDVTGVGHAIKTITVKVDGVQVATSTRTTPCTDKCSETVAVTIGPLSAGPHEITGIATNEFGRLVYKNLDVVVSPPPVPWGFNGGWSGVPNRVAETGIGPNGIGANSSRLEVLWKDVEPNAPGPDGSDPGSEPDHAYQWAGYTPAYDAMVAAGQQPVLLLNSAPNWATDPNQDCPPPPQGDAQTCFEPPTPSHYADFASFAKAAVEKFPGILAVEVWNEPNWDKKWHPTASASQYARLLYETESRLGESQTVLAAGLLPGGRTTRTTYLTSLYNTPALPCATVANPLCARDTFDGIGAHVYPTGGTPSAMQSSFDGIIESIRTVRDSAGDASKPIWVTEVGISAVPPGGTPTTERVDEAVQGDWLASIYENLASDVESFLIFRYQDNFNTDDPQRFDTMGVVRSDYTKKPAWYDLACRIGDRERQCP